jgi:hypothetical protein
MVIFALSANKAILSAGYQGNYSNKNRQFVGQTGNVLLNGYHLEVYSPELYLNQT